MMFRVESGAIRRRIGLDDVFTDNRHADWHFQRHYITYPDGS